MEERIISTRPEYPGYKVVKDLGVITGFDHDFRVIRNLWQIDEPLEKAYEDLWKKAVKKGANAVLGVSLVLAPQNYIPMLIGTAVVLEKENTDEE